MTAGLRVRRSHPFSSVLSVASSFVAFSTSADQQLFVVLSDIFDTQIKKSGKTTIGLRHLAIIALLLRESK